MKACSIRVSVSTSSCILLLIVALASPGSGAHGQSNTSGEAPFGNELRRADESRYFFDSAEIQSLLERDFESLGPNNGIVTSEQLAHRLVRQVIQRTHEADALDERGCLRPRFYRHREEMYQRSPEFFEDPALAGEQTVAILAQQAPEVVIVEAMEARSGLFGAELGTLVRSRVVEWLKQDPKIETTVDPSYFVATDFWLDIGDETYCQVREGVEQPQEGMRYLLLGFRNTGLPEHFVTGNIFPLKDGLVLPQPYPLMDKRLPVPIDELKELLEYGA